MSGPSVVLQGPKQREEVPLKAIGFFCLCLSHFLSLFFRGFLGNEVRETLKFPLGSAQSLQNPRDPPADSFSPLPQMLFF